MVVGIITTGGLQRIAPIGKIGMRLRFTKMHGCGNDFIVIDGLTQKVKLTEERIRQLSDRHFGVGCDQILLVEAPSKPDMDFRYRIFNSDGNEVEHCGNGARCFAKFVRDRKLTAKSSIRVETCNRELELIVQTDGRVSVDMGVPDIKPEAVPFQANQVNDDACYNLTVDDKQYSVSVLSVGNPHAVLVVDDTNSAPVHSLGASVQALSQFPKSVNVGFMQVLSASEINLRVFERGVGETLACGTGACAAVVAGQLRGLLDKEVTVHLIGGDLSIHWAGGHSSMIKTGPATTVFHGQIRL